jgi:hypothetical protein
MHAAQPLVKLGDFLDIEQTSLSEGNDGHIQSYSNSFIAVPPFTIQKAMKHTHPA